MYELEQYIAKIYIYYKYLQNVDQPNLAMIPFENMMIKEFINSSESIKANVQAAI